MINPKNTHAYLIKTGDVRHTMAEGVGCNLLISNQGNLPDVKEETKWGEVIAALDDLKVGWMRVGIIPTAGDGSWDEATQTWDFGHAHFKRLERIGDWAMRNRVWLMFDPFAIPESFRRNGAFFADDPREYAQKLMLPVAQYFRKMNLPCFRYIGLLNENIWGPGKEGFAAVREFYALYKAVREVLDENGFDATTLGLLGPSNLSSWEWPISDFFAAGIDPDPVWVGYDQHLYLYHFDWINENAPDFMTMSEMERYLRRYADYAHKRDKPLFLTELGNMYCGRLFWGERDYDGPYSHASILMDAELIVRSINETVDGFLRWAFCVGERDGRWSFPENTAGGMVKTPATYPMYRLLMRAVRPGAKVLKAEVGAAEGLFRYVFAAAVENPDGNACLLLINDIPGKCINVGLELGEQFKGRKLHRVVCNETRKGEVLPPVEVSESGEGVVMLTPSSLTVLSVNPIG